MLFKDKKRKTSVVAFEADRKSESKGMLFMLIRSNFKHETLLNSPYKNKITMKHKQNN